MGSPPCLRIPLEPFLFPRVGCQAVFRQANGKRGGFHTGMGRVGGGGASRPHRGVSAALFGAERLRLLDLPQWGRAGRNFRLMRMQLMCIIGKNTRYGGGRTQRMRPAVGKIRVGSVRRRFRGDRCQGYGICNGGMPEGVPRGRRMKVLINLQWCKGCGVCVAFCRSGALSLDGDGKPEYAPALCVGCGLCELYCPDLAVECLGEDGPGESGEGA